MQISYPDFCALWLSIAKTRFSSGPRCYSRFTYREVEWGGATCYVVYLEDSRRARFNITFGHHRVVVMVARGRVEVIRGTDEALVEARMRDWI